jgi:hypothetical protein
MKSDKLQYLVGRGLPETRPVGPYDEKVCSFLGLLSESLITRRDFPDVVSFAFFCRRANIARLKAGFCSPELRLGRGLAFHVTPSNIPINFAFSLVFGMLSGNANVVRVPTKNWPQVEVICGAIKDLAGRPEFSDVGDQIAMVRYERDDEITAYFSASCDARVIWGGDATVDAIRRIAIPPRAVEVTFADRYSLCILDADEVEKLDERGIARLADNFYNDTYLVDQNACSSPNLIVWLGSDIERAKGKFWEAVFRAAKKYVLEPLHAMDKYTLLCASLIDCSGIVGVERHENLIYRVRLSSLEGVEKLRGRFGMFFEYEANSIDELAPCVTARWQTMAYFGVKREKLEAFVADNSLRGVDRIVPVGSALDIGVMWDGYDIIRALSRTVEIM